jgi:ribosome-binding factor A
MEQGKRQLKVASLLQDELSSVLRLKFQELTRPALVSLTKVRVTADLSLARVYVSVFGMGTGQGQEEMVNRLGQNKPALRRELGTRIRNQVRVVPDLEFYLDDSLDYADRIEQLLREGAGPSA